MFGKSIQRIPEPSFYYVILAATRFRRTARSRHSNAGGTLRNIGCKYLAKADCGRRTGAKASWRKPWTVD